MNPACPSCIEYECPCPGVEADRAVMGCFTRPDDTTYHSEMIAPLNDDELDGDILDRRIKSPVRGGVSEPPADRGRFQRPTANSREHERPTARVVRRDGSTANADGGAHGSPPAHDTPAAASSYNTTAARIAAVLTGRADPRSVAPLVLYAALDGSTSLADTFRHRYGVKRLATLIRDSLTVG